GGEFDPLRDGDHDHADRCLYRHDHRRQRQPDAYHYGRARREPAPGLHAERFALEPDGGARWRDELRRHDQPDGRLQWPDHAERERTAQRRQRQLYTEPGDGVLDPLGDDEHDHADRYLHHHDHRWQRRPHAHHHGRAHGGGSGHGDV